MHAICRKKRKEMEKCGRKKVKKWSCKKKSTKRPKKEKKARLTLGAPPSKRQTECDRDVQKLGLHHDWGGENMWGGGHGKPAR